MTTTEHLRTQGEPDYYTDQKECSTAVTFRRERIYGKSVKVKYFKGQKVKPSNPRYPSFTQTLFHAGDEDQFEQYRDAINYDPCIPYINTDNNIFDVHVPYSIWDGYKNLDAPDVLNTFRYIFNKFKKGVFVKIVSNKLRVFLPFSKVAFVNEWNIKHDPEKFSSMADFLRFVAKMEGRKFFDENMLHVSKWYSNNCLVRHDDSEGDSNVTVIKNMFDELCEKRDVPDIELFINRRDFPLLTRDGTEPYDHMWGSETQPLVSHSHEKYVPVLSMSTSKRYADIAMPTHEDWTRVQALEGKWFAKGCSSVKGPFTTPWDQKVPTAVFRGGSTGCGTTIETNPRLKAAYISSKTLPDENGVPYIDAGITNWNLRPRKLRNSEFLQTINVRSMPFDLVPKLTPEEQSRYKYIINIDGHVSAFRLSLELSMGSVILLVDSQWSMWFRPLLIPYIHYVPVKEDLSDLISQIKWCRNNDRRCEEIAANAKMFFDTVLQKDGCLDYMQKLIKDLKNATGQYLYNTEPPLQSQIRRERQYLLKERTYPETEKTTRDISTIQSPHRSFGNFQGIQWIFNMMLESGDFWPRVANKQRIASNKLGTVYTSSVAGFPIVLKEAHSQSPEHIHEAYVGITCINEVAKYIPNFMFTFGLCENPQGNTTVVTEHVRGEMLSTYLNSDRFNMTEYLSIIIQLCLALHYAQEKHAFVHYDLTPWNIIIQRQNNPVEFDYIISHNIVYRIKTSIVPIIIDYGKSHVVHDEEHHGYVNMYRVSTVQDILTFLLTSIHEIIKKRLSKEDFTSIVKLATFVTGTKYRKEKFKSHDDLKTFLDNSRSYTNLIHSDKHELEQKTPMSLVKYIYKIFKDTHILRMGRVDTYTHSMDRGNGRQVFDFCLENTNKDRAKTYMSVIARLRQCSLPQPDDPLFLYYTVQTIETNMLSVRNDMMHFLEIAGIDSEYYDGIYTRMFKFLKRTYEKLLKSAETTDISYTIDTPDDKLVPAPYTNETFMMPDKILELLYEHKHNNDYIDLSDYKDIIIRTLLYKGQFSVTSDRRTYYLSNFSRLFETNGIAMKSNAANTKTLISTAKRVYSTDAEWLLNSLLNSKGDCSDANSYLEKYETILENLTAAQ